MSMPTGEGKRGNKGAGRSRRAEMEHIPSPRLQGELSLESPPTNTLQGASTDTFLSKCVHWSVGMYVRTLARGLSLPSWHTNRQQQRFY